MLQKVKRLLLLADTSQDDTLQEIISMVEGRLRIKLGGVVDVPAELTYIVVEVAIIRYNRVASEGTTSESKDGNSTTWLDNDFAPFEKEIAEWLDTQNKNSKKVRFL